MSIRNAIRKLSTSLLIAALLSGLLLALLPAQAAFARACKARHSVLPGDSLGTLARQYKVKVEDLVSANKLYQPYTIYVYQILCIPANSSGPTSIPSYANSLAADFTPRLRGNSLEISTRNFPSSATYYVKVGLNTPGKQRIALLKTGSGLLQANFSLPDNLVQAKSLSVCLKNVVTDANVCRTATR